MIIYGSEYGYTSECVQNLAKEIDGDVLTINVCKEIAPDIKEFDNLIIGGSIYMGQIQKKIKEFCTKNIAQIQTKKLGLFLSCGVAENFETHLANSFPEELLKCTTSKQCFGGELRLSKMKFMHKTIANMMLKMQEKAGNPPIKQFPENIAKLADTFKMQTEPI